MSQEQIAIFLATKIPVSNGCDLLANDDLFKKNVSELMMSKNSMQINDVLRPIVLFQLRKNRSLARL